MPLLRAPELFCAEPALGSQNVKPRSSDGRNCEGFTRLNGWEFPRFENRNVPQICIFTGGRKHAECNSSKKNAVHVVCVWISHTGSHVITMVTAIPPSSIWALCCFRSYLERNESYEDEEQRCTVLQNRRAELLK